jgi:hypothetical protein
MSFFNPLTELKNEKLNILVSIITQIAQVEGPVHHDVVIERVRIAYQLGKVSGTTREKVSRAIQLAKDNKRIVGNDEFIWVTQQQLYRRVRYPVDGNVEHISPMELKSVTLMVAKAMFGIPQNDLITEIARLLKFNRTGIRIVEVLSKTIEGLISEGSLVESFGMLHVNDSVEPTSNNRESLLDQRTSENSYLHEKPKKDNPSILNLITRFKNRGLEVIDNRSSGGYLWIVGPQSLWLQLKPMEGRDFDFHFVPSGDRATQNRSAWRIQDNSL